MRFSSTWQVGRAAATMWSDRGLAVMRFSGELVLDGAKSAAEAYAAQVARQRAVAGVVDYAVADTGAALSGLSRQRILAVAKRTKIDALPTAWIVKSDELAAWRQQALRMNAAGLLRAAFDDPEAARQWAAEMAELQQAQLRYLARSR